MSTFSFAGKDFAVSSGGRMTMFSFAGREMVADGGQSVGAALVAAGHPSWCGGGSGVDRVRAFSGRFGVGV
jgi:hypothetical protein